MRASDVRVGQGEVIELRPVGREDFGATFVKQTEVLLHWTDTADEVLLHDGQQTWSVSGADQPAVRIALNPVGAAIRHRAAACTHRLADRTSRAPRQPAKSAKTGYTGSR